MTSSDKLDKPKGSRKAKWGVVAAIGGVVIGLATYVVNDRKLADLKDKMATLDAARGSLEAFNADDTQKVESFMNAPDGTSGEDRIERLNRFMIGTGDAEVTAIKSFLERVPNEAHEMSFSSINGRYQDARESVLTHPPNGDMDSFNAATNANGQMQRAQAEVRSYIGTLLEDAKVQSESGEGSYGRWKRISLFVVLIGAVFTVVGIFISRKAPE